MIAFILLFVGVSSFAPSTLISSSQKTLFSLYAEGREGTNAAPIVGKRIIVKGDVNGGYVRTCIHNEVREFHGKQFRVKD